MKVVFLDIDGVLLTRQDYTDMEGRRNVHTLRPQPSTVANLNKILAATNAKIVVSSSWRVGRSVKQLSQKLSAWGVTPKSVVGATSTSPLGRGEEISEWLRNHENIESFVILDDDVFDMLDLIPNIVHTHFETGLQEEHVAKAINILRTGEKL